MRNEPSNKYYNFLMQYKDNIDAYLGEKWERVYQDMMEFKRLSGEQFNKNVMREYIQ